MGSACSSEPQNNIEKQPIISDNSQEVEKIPDLEDSNKSSDNKIMSTHKPIKRTISVLKQQEEDERLKRNPQMRAVLAGCFDVRQNIVELCSESDFDEYEDLHKLLNEKLITPFNNGNDEQRLMMGDHLSKVGFLKPLVDLYEKILEDNNLLDGISPTLDDEDENEPYYQAIKDIRTVLWNFSDSSKDFGMAIPEETNLFESLVKDLQITFKEGLQNLTSEEFSFNSAVAIITNCGRAGVKKSLFNVEVHHKQRDGAENAESVNMVDVLIPFLKSEEQFVKLTTLLALSYMINEDQSRILTADTSLIDFLLDMIKLAIKDKEKRYSGFSVHELIEGLAGLAKDDDNKIKIMNKKDTFPLLKKCLLNKKSEDEQLAAVRAIWELAFVGKNKQKFSEDKELMSQFEALQKHKNKDIANSAGRALFIISPNNEANLMKSVEDKKSHLEDPEQKHIMISYQWSNQKIILQIKDKLRENNFPVWIDVDFMEGSMLQMMASAIEKAAVVLVCYSEKYKDSKNCRTEAEYAFARDKVVIPVLLQRGYRPDGWLGILVGAKKYYEFSDKYDFEMKFQEMKSELEGYMHQKQRKSSIMPSDSRIPAVIHEENEDGIVLLRWRKEDIQNWLEQNKLEMFSGLHSLTGEQLGFLYKLYRRAPDFFYKCLESKLGLKSLEDLMKFDKALEKLSQQYPEINKLLQG